jgi:hypothetical protein
MRCKNIFIIIFSLFFLGTFISITSASFTLSNSGNSITTEYEASGYLEADINISFLNQPLDSVFQDSLNNSIELSDLLSENPGYFYIFSDSENTTISSAFQILKLGYADFQMPSAVDSFTYQLNLSKGEVNEEVFKRTFEIKSIGSSVEDALNEKYSELNKSKTEIKGYDFFVQKALNKFLNITLIENNLEELEIKYENAETDEEYTEILDNISAINLPTNMLETISVNDISFYPKEENINLEILAEIGGGSYTNEDKYIDAIYMWNINNLVTTMSFREVDITYKGNEKYKLKIFDFQFDKTNMNEDTYFIIQKMGGTEFEDLDYPLAESNGYLYLNLNEISNEIIFSTTTNINFLDVPVFISPSIETLDSQKIGTFERWEKKPKWALFIILIVLLVLIAGIAYVLLQMWYRRKYEAHLFKTRNNLYNLMIYIENSKRKGMPKEEVMKNLKKAGWAKEQIDYAIRKYEDKKIPGIVHKPLNMGPQETKNISEKR